MRSWYFLSSLLTEGRCASGVAAMDFKHFHMSTSYRTLAFASSRGNYYEQRDFHELT
jgi:hypothetical protein